MEVIRGRGSKEDTLANSLLLGLGRDVLPQSPSQTPSLNLSSIQNLHNGEGEKSSNTKMPVSQGHFFSIGPETPHVLGQAELF